MTGMGYNAIWLKARGLGLSKVSEHDKRRVWTDEIDDWKLDRKYRFEVLDIEKQNKKIEDSKIGWDRVLWFGKHEGKTLKECPKRYIEWLIDNTKHEFKNEIKEALR